MKPSDYQTIINQTKVYPDSTTNFGPAYVALGLSGETGELLDAIDETYFKDIFVQRGVKAPEKERVVKEAGDVLWYVTAGCIELGIDLDEIWPVDEANMYFENQLESAMITLRRTASGISEVTKKFYRDDRDLISFGMYIKVEYIVILSCLSFILNMYKSSLEECAETNYNKLIKRRETNTLHGSGDNREDKT